jgi:hypothetical protein
MLHMTLEADELILAFVFAQRDLRPVIAPGCRHIPLHSSTFCCAEKNKLPL